MVALRPVWFAIVLALLFLIPTAPTYGPSDAATTPTTPAGDAAYVRIQVPAAETASLGSDVQVVQTYDSFVLARAGAAAVSRLAARGVTVVPEDVFSLHVNGYLFDTRDGIQVPAALEAPAPMGLDYYIVQFVGPIKEEWRSELEALGAEVLGYVPNNAYVVRATVAEFDAAKALSVVQWTGAYQPAFRIAPDLLAADGTVTVKIITFQGEVLGGVLSTLNKLGLSPIGRWSPGVGILAWGQFDTFGLVRVRLDASLLVSLARLPMVRYIEAQEEMQLDNQQEQYVLQTNATSDVPGAKRIWDMGIHGELQTIALADTGLDYDHTMFRESQNEVVLGSPPPGPNDIYNLTSSARRKVVRYLTMSQYLGVDPWGTDPGPRKDGPDGFCGFGHGTATSGSAAGYDATMTPADLNDGMATAAKLVMMDIGRVDQTTCNDVLAYIPDDYATMFGAGYAVGARIFSNSWGGTSSAYTAEARELDAFVWNYPDATIFFANGNTGTVGSPATAKNDIAVSGADSIANREAMGPVARGPTTDGRRKPEITTFYQTTSPGGTAISDGDLASLNSGTGGFAGTSFSTPLAAGMAALARQYFMEGWYPRGVKGGLGLAPSAALMKALLSASSVQMIGSGSCPGADAFYPNIAQGWGRLWLDEALYFAGDTKKLFVVDHPTGMLTGDTIEYKVRVASATGRLRVLLAWSDFPGLEGASPALVNNLDLEVIDPSGTSYKGNVRGPCAAGQSATGGAFDVLNNLEGVIRLAPAAGDWRIRVIAANVPMGLQKFGLVVLSDLDRNYGIVEVDKTRYGEGETVTIKLTDADAVAPVTVLVTTPTEPAGETVTLNPLVAGSNIWRGTIVTNYGVPAADGKIQISHQDTLSITFNDASPPHASVATARLELDGPAIWDVRITGITNAYVTISWKTDKQANTAVYFGATPALGSSVTNAVMVTSHSIQVSGLSGDTLYYFDVASTYTGHTTRDANDGLHYRFKTTEMAEILLVLTDSAGFTAERLEMYRSALAGASWSWNEWDVARQGDPTLATLQTYKVILWQSGLEQYPPMTDAQQALMRTYVDGGGRVMFSGHDHAWAACDPASQYTSPSRCSFVRSIMKGNYQDDPAFTTWSQEVGASNVDPISGIYAVGSTPGPQQYYAHRDGAAADEVGTLNAGGNTNAVWQTNSPNPIKTDGVRWVSSGNNGTTTPGCVWCGTPSRVVSYFFEFTGIDYVSGVYNNPVRTDILNKTIVYLLGRTPPVVKVSSPNGGETITTNTLTVTWQRSQPLATQQIWYSDDGGAGWSKVTDVGATLTTYDVDVSAWPNGNRYMIRVIAYDTGPPQFKAQDASDATFRIDRVGGDVSGPLGRPGSLRLFPNPARNNQTLTFNATVDDLLRGISDISAAEYFVQDTEPAPAAYGTGLVLNATDGTFDTATENVTTSFKCPWPGGTWHTVWVHARDAANPTQNWGPFLNRTFLVINGTSGVVPNPPTAVNANLEGGTSQDVRISWAYAGPAVDKFQIYFGSNYDPTKTGYALLQDNIAPTETSWVHAGAGSGNANNYFYYVRAMATGGGADSAGQSAKFTRALTGGWNLVSIPVTLQNTALSSVFQTMNWRSARTYVASDPADKWKAWSTVKNNGDLRTVSTGMALWVDLVAPDDFTVAGAVPASTALTLAAGWNFVGYGSFIVRSANVAFPGGLGVNQMEAYSPAPQYYLQRVPLTTNLEPGKAYWVYATIGGSWTVTN